MPVHVGQVVLEPLLQLVDDALDAFHVALVVLAHLRPFHDGHEQLEGVLLEGPRLVEGRADVEEDGRHAHVHALDVADGGGVVGVGRQHRPHRLPVHTRRLLTQVRRRFGAFYVFGDLVVVVALLGRQPVEADPFEGGLEVRGEEEAFPEAVLADEATGRWGGTAG